MKKFIVKETRPATAIWTYEVEAVSESEAVAKVFDENDIQKVNLAYDVDFAGEMGVDIEEETPASECECTPECDCTKYTFTEAQLVEFTQMLMDQALNAAKESIRDSGVDMESYVELDIYDRNIEVSVDDVNIYKEIISNLEDAFGMDDDDIKDQMKSIFDHINKV